VEPTIVRAETAETFARRSTANFLTSLRLIASSRIAPNRGRMWTRSMHSYFASVTGPAGRAYHEI
jgi:hypothetical protein